MQVIRTALLCALLAGSASAIEIRTQAGPQALQAVPALPGQLAVQLESPLAQAVLVRAQAGPGLANVGAVIQKAGDLPTAVASLEVMGLIKPGELELKTPGDVSRAVDTLEQVWYHAAPRTQRDLPVDSSSPVPAIVAHNGGVTYHVHALFPHPSRIGLTAPRAKAVRRFAGSVENLYSEKNLPAAYRYAEGKEIVDQEGGEPLSAAYLREPVTTGSAFSANTAVAAFSAFTGGLAVAIAAAHPDKPWAWALAAGVVLYNYLFWTAWVPLRRLRELVRASFMSRDAGLNHARWARAVFTSKPDIDEYRRVKLPLRESSHRATDFGGRPEAIARAVADDAKAKGLKEVHILTGANHAGEVARILAEGRTQIP